MALAARTAARIVYARRFANSNAMELPLAPALAVMTIIESAQSRSPKVHNLGCVVLG